MKTLIKKSIFIIVAILFSATTLLSQKTIMADEIRNFNDYGYALVKRGNLWGVIDTMENFILDYSIETSEYNKDIYLFEDIIVLKDRNTFYYNLSGELIAESNHSELVSFNEGVTILWDK